MRKQDRNLLYFPTFCVRYGEKEQIKDFAALPKSYLVKEVKLMAC